MPKNSNEPKKFNYGIQNLTRKNVKLDLLDQDEEAALYAYMLLKSVVMLKKFTEKYGDKGRTLLVELKYKLSACPLTYKIIHDMLNNPENWDISTSLYVTHQSFYDKVKNINFNLYNHSSGINRSSYDEYFRQGKKKFVANNIKLFYNGEYSMFTDNEKVIVAKVLYTYNSMLQNLEELKKQQRIHENAVKLKGLY